MMDAMVWTPQYPVLNPHSTRDAPLVVLGSRMGDVFTALPLGAPRVLTFSLFSHVVAWLPAHLLQSERTTASKLQIWCGCDRPQTNGMFAMAHHAAAICD
jgi:hypothetical protein